MADKRPKEQNEKAESCRENLWNEIQLKCHKDRNRQRERKRDLVTFILTSTRTAHGNLGTQRETESLRLCQCWLITKQQQQTHLTEKHTVCMLHKVLRSRKLPKDSCNLHRLFSVKPASLLVDSCQPGRVI